MLKISDAESPLSDAERQYAQTILRRRRMLAFYSTLALVLGCAAEYPFLAGHSLHAYWNSIGKQLLLLPLALFIVFVYMCAMWYAAWQAFSDVEKV